MKAKELIRHLQSLPPDEEVYVEYHTHDHLGRILAETVIGVIERRVRVTQAVEGTKRSIIKPYDREPHDDETVETINVIF